MTKQRSGKAAAPHETEMTRFNAVRHGVLSRTSVLPWEDGEEYDALFRSLAEEHRPMGPTEQHLVEELAGIVWRKGRLRLAEAATYRRGLSSALAPHREVAKAALIHKDGSDPERIVDAVRASAADTEAERADLEADEIRTRRALDLLGHGQGNAYRAALAALREDTRQWWADILAREEPELEDGEELLRADAESLRQFIEDEVLPWFQARQRDLDNRPLVREQAFGEALDPDKLDRLGRYEVHLDRKFERTLAMLLRLKDLRRPTLPD